MTTFESVSATELPNLFSDAIDEVYRLRSLFAYEATLIVEHLTFKTFPKNRRQYAEEQVSRMREAACGHVELAYAGQSHLSLDWAIRSAVNVKRNDRLPEVLWPVSKHPLGPRSVDEKERQTFLVNLERATTEIFELRRALAHESMILKAHTSPASFPKSRARVIGEQRNRMESAARGDSTLSTPELIAAARVALRTAGAKETLTNWAWIDERKAGHE
jgi:hypothetical protein